MSLNYTTWLQEAANLAGTTVTQPNFVIEAPNAIDYAEQRIYRDIPDMLTTVTRDSTQSCAPGSRNVPIPAAFVVVSDINVISPAGAAPDNGQRNPLRRTSEAFLDFSWPSNTGAALPTRYVVLSPTQLLLGPWPDQGYVVEYIGTQRPAPLSASNPTTFLSLNLPDLFLVATMIHLSGYQKNFGAQADDPRTAVSWEGQYKNLLASADAEELRKRYAGSVAGPMPGGSGKPQAPPAAGG